MTEKTPTLARKDACSCGARCPYEDNNPNEPCWGDVDPFDSISTPDGDIFLHACKGHADRYYGHPYRPETGITGHGPRTACRIPPPDARA
jgi:hypothetical protein